MFASSPCHVMPDAISNAWLCATIHTVCLRANLASHNFLVQTRWAQLYVELPPCAYLQIRR